MSPEIVPKNTSTSVGSQQTVESRPKLGPALSARTIPLNEAILPKPTRSYGLIKTSVQSGRANLDLIGVIVKDPETNLAKIPKSAVFFIPGYWSSAQTFYGGMKELAKDHGVSSFSFSTEGHGRSTGSEKKAIYYSIGRYLKNLTDTIEHLKKSGVENLHLVGSSFGAHLARLYLGTTQDPHIASMTLVCATPNYGTLAGNLRFALNYPIQFIKANLFFDASQALDRNSIAGALFSTSPDQIPANFEPQKESMLANIQTLFGISRDVISRIKQTKAKIQIIGANQDRIISLDETLALAKDFGVSATLLPGSHMAIVVPEQRKAFMAAIASALS